MTYQMLFMLGGGLGLFLLRYEYAGGRSGEDCRQRNEASAGDTDHQPVNGRAGRPFGNGNHSELQCYYGYGSGFC
jgi:hypothetical protein